MPASGSTIGGLQLFADAADPDRPRREAGRHVGAEPRRQLRQHRRGDRAARQVIEQAQRRRRVARSAADPRGRRQALVERQRRRAGAAGGRRYRAGRRAARDCRRRDRRAPLASEPPTASDGISAGDALDPVSDIGEDHQAVEQVVAIGAPPDDMQKQIDLRRGENAGRIIIARPGEALRLSRRTSAAAGRRGGGVEPVLDLGLDRLDLVLLRSELQRPAPLVARFDDPPDRQ